MHFSVSLWWVTQILLPGKEDPSPRLLRAPSAVSPFRDGSAANSHPAQGHDPSGQPPPVTYQLGGVKISQLHPAEDTAPGIIPAQALPVGAIAVSVPKFSFCLWPARPSPPFRRYWSKGQSLINTPLLINSISDSASGRTQLAMLSAMETNSSESCQFDRVESCLV